MTAYYNEIEPYAAQWLRNLIGANLIAPGDVDTRSIKDIQPDDLSPYIQCHFFAGIGGWSYALRQADWPDNKPVWTGSCPCQPFSLAGQRAGFADPRHLWPDWLALIRESKPSSVFGEQVASASDWLALVHSDLEALGYAVGAVPIEAASAGADHRRDRYWFVAYDYTARSSLGSLAEDQPGDLRDERPTASSCSNGNSNSSLAYDQQPGSLPAAFSGIHSRKEGSGSRDVDVERYGSSDSNSSLALTHDPERRPDQPTGHQPDGSASRRHEGDSYAEECSNESLVSTPQDGAWEPSWTELTLCAAGFTAPAAGLTPTHQYIACPDGKYRRLPPPGVCWLANGLPARVPRIRALGNAIDPRPAAAFITAAMACAP